MAAAHYGRRAASVALIALFWHPARAGFARTFVLSIVGSPGTRPRRRAGGQRYYQQLTTSQRSHFSPTCRWVRWGALKRKEKLSRGWATCFRFFSLLGDAQTFQDEGRQSDAAR
jgi:hypothetical protein